MILVRVLSARTFIIIRTIAIRIVIHMIIHFIPPKRYRSYYKENYSINQPRDCEIYVISGFLLLKTESVLFLQQQNLFVFF